MARAKITARWSSKVFGARRAVGPWRYQALNQALRDAAERASVPWIDYRAMHGFRRFAVGEVLRLTGNLTRAGQWIGDTDARTLSRSYVRPRAEELRDVARQVAAPTVPMGEAAPKAQQPVQPNSNGQPVRAGRGGVNP